MKVRKSARVLSLVVLLVSFISTNQPARASASSVDGLNAITIDRNLDYWDNNYIGYVSSSIYENWWLGLSEYHNFIVTISPITGDFIPVLILLDADGNELTRGIGTITSAQPAGDYSILVQPQIGAGFYFLTLRDVTQTQPLTTTLLYPSSLNVSETAMATVGLNNVPAEGYTSAEFTCLYDSIVVEVSNIVVHNRFGPDPAVAINGSQNNSFIVAVASSHGYKATTSGVVFTFDLKSLQTGHSAIECTARVSKGDNVLVDLPSIGSRLTVLGTIPTPTPSPAVCDQAEFVADVNMPPGTAMAPGTQFLKTWRLKNVGTCTWTTSYQLVFFSGEQMGAVASAIFSRSVAPGQTVDISLNMTAPAAPGRYRGYWMFKNANGALFGAGPQGNEPWFVDIIVSGATPTPTFQPILCDKTQFIADVNIPDGTVFSPGETFIKTWRLKNVGSCVWTTSYRIVFFSGEQMNAPSSFHLPVNVSPGQTVDISVSMTAPSVPGSYRSYWMFQNANGALFGIGTQANKPWWMDIRVSGPSATPGNPTNSPVPSNTPGGPTLTPSFTPTPTTPPTPCDKAEFIADVSIPPGTVMSPGAQFKKTWRLKNVGSCTWMHSYRIAFFSGEQMGAISFMQLPLSVAPGATVDISLNMTAPSTAGAYRGYWMFQNATGGLFGIGRLGNDPWFVDIVVSNTTVTPEPTYTQSPAPFTPTATQTPGVPTMTPIAGVAYDFASSACEATWYSRAGRLLCPGINGDVKGFVLIIDTPKLETGATDTRPGLLTFPQNVQAGYLQGVYPSIHIQNGDRFRSTLTCEFGATNCYVAFRLDYQAGSDPVNTFWGPFLERYEGQYFSVDVDLSPLAGKDVKFILTVLSAGNPTGDRALWVGPIIYRTGGALNTPVASNTPTPSPAAAASTYQNVKYDFKFTLPTGATIVSQSDNDGRVNLPFISGTNLLDRFLIVSVVENANPCTSPVLGGSPISSEDIVINNIPFTKQTGSESIIGNTYDWVSYATVHNAACISLAFVLRSGNPGVYVTPPPLFDKDAESAVFTQIVSTFTWLTTLPIFTTTPVGSPTSEMSFTPTAEISPTFTQTPTAWLTPTEFTGTPMPAFGLLTGKVFASKLVRIEAYNADNTLVGAGWVNTEGSFEFHAPSGTNSVIAMASGFLSAQLSVTITDGSTTTLPTITLIAGDIDNNNVIDQFDALTIGMSYNTSFPATADLNNDGIINVLDLELLAQNYRSIGPTVWQ